MVTRPATTNKGLRYRQVTDPMDKLCAKQVDWGAFGSLMTVFNWDLIIRCIAKLPANVYTNFNRLDKVRYLYAICEKHAGLDDYIKKIQKPLLKIDDFKL